MTIATQTESPWGEFAGAGQEAVSAGDLQVPRIKIIGKEAMFENSVTKEKFDNVTVIVLGLIKQRVFFHPSSEHLDKGPICKSNNFTTGFPTEPTMPPSDRNPIGFPWQASGFAQVGPHPAYNRVALPCDSCQMKEWRETGDRKTPPCSELHTYPVIIIDPETREHVGPAVFSFKGSGITASKGFISSFASGGGRPFFTAYTKITLQAKSRGTTDYAVPVFQPLLARDHMVPKDLWRELNTNYESVRDMLMAAPRTDEEDAPEATSTPLPDNSWGQAAEAPAAPTPDPWAEYQTPQAGPSTWPAASAPAQPSAPVAAQPQQPPAAPPAAPSVPVAAPPAPTPTQVAAPVPPPVSAPIAPPVQATPPPPAVSNNPLPF